MNSAEYKKLREQKRIASGYYEKCAMQRETSTWKGTLKFLWESLVHKC